MHMLNRDHVLAQMRERVYHPAGIRELLQLLRVPRDERSSFKRHLASLVASGDLIQLRGQRFGLPEKMDLHVGRLQTHPGGYGFVVPERSPDSGDIYIAGPHLNEAMHGDRVVARVERVKDGGRLEGRIIRILERSNTRLVGRYDRDQDGMGYVVPFDRRVLMDVVVPNGQEGGAAPGEMVTVELTRWPTATRGAIGRVDAVLGTIDAPGVDTEIIINKYGIPDAHSPEAVAEAVGMGASVSARDIAGRSDFRDLATVTIDGEHARDFDDAITIDKLPNGHYWLGVHIADVSHYVQEGSVLDREAYERGTSVYFPERAVHMFPAELATGLCSLNPHVDRLVQSCFMEIDRHGQVVRSEFHDGVINSTERMTYTAVNAVLQGDAAATAQYAHLAEDFRLMRDLAMILNARRARLGSIDFDLPAPVIEFDDAGKMTGIVRSERNIAHRLIEEFMLTANQAVARYLERRGLGSLHRVHEKPDPKKILEFEELAHTFGYTLGIENLSERLVAVKHGNIRAPQSRRGGQGRHGRSGGGRERPMTVAVPGALDIAIRPEHYQRLAEKIAGKPEERIVSYLMLRSLKQARYAADPLGHFALAFDQYTHFTSPIRRYPDLIVHRVLKWALEHPESRPVAPAAVHEGLKHPHGVAAKEVEPHGAALKKIEPRGLAPKDSATFGPYRRGELEAVADETSETERRAETAERELMAWKTAQFMEQHLGEEYAALVISVQKFGFFVELMEIFVEGIVPITRIEELTGEQVFYRERDHAIVSGSGGGHRSGSRDAASSRSGASPRTKSGRGARSSPRSDRGEHVWKLGDRIRVRAERIDPIRRRVEFSPLL